MSSRIIKSIRIIKVEVLDNIIETFGWVILSFLKNYKSVYIIF